MPLPYLYLRGDVEDLVDEGDLSCYFLPIDIFDLSLAEHGHRFIPLKGASSRIDRVKAQTRLTKRLMRR